VTNESRELIANVSCRLPSERLLQEQIVQAQTAYLLSERVRESRLPAQKWQSAQIAQPILAKPCFLTLPITLKKWHDYDVNARFLFSKAQHDLAPPCLSFLHWSRVC